MSAAITAAPAPACHDPVLIHDWHPVARTSSIAAGTPAATSLLGREIALWRDSGGAVHAWEDRCPHRGTRFSAGRVVDDQLVCAYHAWRFDAGGRCTLIPAMPAQRPPQAACATVFHAREAYGLVWVCVGTPAADVLPFPEHADARLNKVVCGPYDVATGGARIVENFLDMAHFPFVHTGILGAPAHTEVRDYLVESWDDGSGLAGPRATGCKFWQPQTNSLAHGGSEVEYTYRVVRPLTAILTKVPEAQQGFYEAISLHVQPLAEDQSRVWIILALTNFVQSEAELAAFQDRIFLQDKPIVEAQVPARLPLAPAAEVSMACDRMSVAYRRYLAARGLTWGVIP
jgi:phenylpropionate dioxygenase-like ring-hydroxylating dioxygenase large terminal subunit